MDFRRLSPRSNRVLVPLALLALLALLRVEQGKRVVKSPWHDQMLSAAATSARAARALKEHRLNRGAFVDRVNDPAGTALIGQEYSQITTEHGNLEAKLASTDPNFAAAVVAMVHELRLARGACVAVAMTGSFPALNLSTLAALETVGLRPVLISSVGASSFGATDPYFTWLDMEREVAEQGILATRSVAASVGGSNDVGRGLAPKGRALLHEAIARNNVPLLAERRLEDSIRARVEIFRQRCAPQPVAAYLNVGGGIASLGHAFNADLIPIGASERLPHHNYPARGALLRLADEGAPVIHLLGIRKLRAAYGLAPALDKAQPPGRGGVYGQVRYRVGETLVATLALLAVLIALYTWDQHLHRLGTAGGSPTGEPTS